MDPVPATPPVVASRWKSWLFFASLPLALIAAGSLAAPWLWLGELCVHVCGLAALALGPALVVCWRRPLQAAILLLALILGCWPWWRSAQEPRAAVANQPTFTVATVNLYDFNAQREAALARLGELQVDVLAVQEVQTSDHQALMRRWPHMVVSEQRHLLASALFSRHPILWSFVHDLGGFALIDALVQMPTGQVRIYVAHLQSPTSPGRLANRTRQLTELALLIRESAEPVLLLGDFNLGSVSPRWSAFAAGAGIRLPPGSAPGTWPAWLGPAGTDIDHVAGRGLAFTPLDTLSIPGSDHRGLITACSIDQTR
jgi:endonuclease/exonuclease/phosphatase (EEP) superfamily protein YafD